MRRIGGFLLATGVAIAGAEALAQDDPICDRGLRPVANAFGYVLRDDNQRCEGLYESAVRAVEIEVVSLTYGRLRYDLEHDQVLRVHAPDVAAMIEAPLRLRALALPLKAYYRLDAVMPGDGPLDWPLNDVLRPARLESRQLGLFGWADDDGARLFVPVWARAAGEDAAESAPAAPREPIALGVRISGEAESVLWRIADAERPADWQTARDGRVLAGQVLSLEIPDGDPGRLRVEVAAKWLRSDDWSTLRIDILRPSR